MKSTNEVKLTNTDMIKNASRLKKEIIKELEEDIEKLEKELKGSKNEKKNKV